jgi:hypothetical protein
MEIKYCRREIGAANENISPLFCMKPVAKKNALDWCEACRERLPLWPATVEAYEKHIAPAVAATIADRPTFTYNPKQLDINDPRAIALVAECMAVDMTGAVEEVAAMLNDRQAEFFRVEAR